MPGPDPGGIADYEIVNGGVVIWHRWQFWAGNGGNERRNRAARIKAVAKNIARDGWTCRHCGEEISLDLRADAKHCSAPCRGAAWRERQGPTKNLMPRNGA